MTNKTHDADVAFIKALAELLNENDLTELQVKRDYAEDDSLNVRVSRKPPQQVMAAPSNSTKPPRRPPPHRRPPLPPPLLRPLLPTPIRLITPAP